MRMEGLVHGVEALERLVGGQKHLILSSIIHCNTVVPKRTMQNLLLSYPHPAQQPPDLLRLNAKSNSTALSNISMVVCNCVNEAKLELHFPEFLSYTISGWRWCEQDLEAEVKGSHCFLKTVVYRRGKQPMQSCQ